MKVLNQQIDFKANLLFSLRRYRLWWAILVVTAVFDYLTTLQFVSRLGVSAEANPIARWLIDSTGLFTGLLIGKILQILAVAGFAGLHRRLDNLMLLIVIVLNCWAVVINATV